eukprot:gb/GEZN01000999.1/.p1 GENE.gb/GEZN01000999.1/~~gb/GEZN01000999.1/.p1  ORF type:complete len:977 (-),score=139.20 gb/GEZN01000999.1/:451-3381(-)
MVLFWLLVITCATNVGVLSLQAIEAFQPIEQVEAGRVGRALLQANGPGSPYGQTLDHRIMLGLYLCGVVFMLAWSIAVPAPLTVASNGNMVAVLLVGTLELVLLSFGQDSARAMAWWQLLFGCLFPASLFANGVFQHFLVPYGTPDLVPALKESLDPPPGPLWVTYTSDAWKFAVVTNLYGTIIHIYTGFMVRAAIGSTAGSWAIFVFGLLVAIWLCRGVRKQLKGFFAPKDKAWYPQRCLVSSRATAWRRHSSVSGPSLGSLPQGRRIDPLRPSAPPPLKVMVAPNANVPTFSRYVRMRDGVELAVDVYLPLLPGDDESLAMDTPRPVFLNLTRYNRNMLTSRWCCGLLRRLLGLGPTLNLRTLRYIKALAPRGYAVVSVDVRGTGASGGFRSVDLSPVEVDDFKEIVAWLRSEDCKWANSEQITTGGISYDGMTGVRAAVNAEGGIRAVVLSFTPVNVYQDLVFPGGIPTKGFVRDYTSFCSALEHDMPPPVWDDGKRDCLSATSWFNVLTCHQPNKNGIVFLRLKVRFLLTKLLGQVAPVDSDKAKKEQYVAAHARNWDAWQEFSRIQYRDDVVGDAKLPLSGLDLDLERDVKSLVSQQVACRLYCGYFDSGSIRSALSVYQAYQRHGAPRGLCSIVMGPYQHGARAHCSPFSPEGPTRAQVKFNMYLDIGVWLDAVLARRIPHIKFAHDTLPIRYFTMQQEQWRGADHWPLLTTRDVKYQLYAAEQPRGRRMALLERANVQVEEGEVIEFRVDQEASSGYVSRWNLVQHLLGQSVTYPDRKEQDENLLVFETPLKFKDHMCVTGSVLLDLTLEVKEGDEVCVFAYLEDVDPDGKTVKYITEGQLRASHRPVSWNDNKDTTQVADKDKEGQRSQFQRRPVRSFFKRHQKLLSGVERVQFELEPVSHRFNKDHRIRLTLAGADNDNFEQGNLGPLAESWRVHLKDCAVWFPLETKECVGNLAVRRKSVVTTVHG